MHSIAIALGVMLLISSPPQQVPKAPAGRVPVARLTTPSLGGDPSKAPIGPRPLAEIRFTLYQNAVIIPAVVNGRDTVHLLLDTGWGPLALVAAAAHRLRLPLHGPGPGGLGQARLHSLSIGQVVQSAPFVQVFPTDALAPLIGPHDGVLSTAFFRDLVVQIDYPAGIVRFFRRSPITSPPAANAQRASVPMVFSPGAGALPFTDSVFVNGRPVRGLFDTGGAGAFVAMPQLVERASLRPLPDSGPIGIGLLHGATVVRQAVHFTRVRRVALGPFTVDSPRVMIAPPQMAGDDWGHDLVIGYGFLRHYIVTFDYPDKLVTLERPGRPQSPNPSPVPPPSAPKPA